MSKHQKAPRTTHKSSFTRSLLLVTLVASFALTACTDDRRTYSGSDLDGEDNNANSDVEVDSNPFDEDEDGEDDNSDVEPEPMIDLCADSTAGFCGVSGVSAGEWEEDTFGYGTVEDGGSHTLPEEWFMYDVWVTNTLEGTVSRFDPRTRAEVGRYNALAADSELIGCISRAENCPTHIVSVHSGMVIVGNSSLSNAVEPSITLIAAGRSEWGSSCADRDGDGVITTSTDVNGDGRIDVADPAEFPGDADECVITTQRLKDEVDQIADLVVVPYTGGHGGGNTVVAYMGSGEVISAQMYGAAVDGGVLLDQTPSRVSQAVSSPAGLLWAVGDERDDIIKGSAFGSDGHQALDASMPSCRTSNVPLMTIDGTECIVAMYLGCRDAIRVCSSSQDGVQTEVVGFDGAPIALSSTAAAGVTSWDVQAGEPAVLHNWTTGATTPVVTDETTNTVADLTNLHSFEPGAPGLEAWAIDGTLEHLMAVNLETGVVERIEHDIIGHIGDLATLGTALQSTTGNYGRVQEGVALDCPDGTALTRAELHWDADLPEGTELDVRVGSSPEAAEWVAMPLGPFTESPADLLEADPALAPFLIMEFGLSSTRWGNNPSLHGFRVVYECE